MKKKTKSNVLLGMFEKKISKFFAAIIKLKPGLTEKKLVSLMKHSIEAIKLEAYANSKEGILVLKKRCVVHGVSANGKPALLIERLTKPTNRNRLINQQQVKFLSAKLGSLVERLNDKKMLTLAKMPVRRVMIKDKPFFVHTKNKLVFDQKTLHAFGVLNETTGDIEQLSKEQVKICMDLGVEWDIPTNLNTEEDETDLRLKEELKEELGDEDFKKHCSDEESGSDGDDDE